MTAVALPQWVRPQLTELVDAAPDGSQWLQEMSNGNQSGPRIGMEKGPLTGLGTGLSR